jgi:hypothetical protein
VNVNRQRLVAIALLATMAALGIHMLTAPETGPPSPLVPALELEAPAQATNRPAKAPRASDAALDELFDAIDREANPSSPDEDPPPWDGEPEKPEALAGTLAARCQKLQTQANLIEDLVRLEADGLVDASREPRLATQLAALSRHLLTDSEQLWTGDMFCQGAPTIHLGDAAALLERLQEKVNLDDQETTEVAAALDALGQVDWN